MCVLCRMSALRRRAPSGNFSNNESNGNNNNNSHLNLLTLEPTKDRNKEGLHEIYNDHECSYSSKEDAKKTVVVFKDGKKTLLINAPFFIQKDALPAGAKCFIYKTQAEVDAEQKKYRNAEDARIIELMKNPNRLYEGDFHFLVKKGLIKSEEYMPENQTSYEVEGYKPGFEQTYTYYIKKKNIGGSRKRRRGQKRKTRKRRHYK
jgi:hypothetical protein